MVENNSVIIEMTADIVSAYVGNNSVQSGDLPILIQTIHAALNSAATGAAAATADVKQEPAVSIRKSISPDALICLEDGKKFKSLKRHLRSKYNMSPEDYRAKWGLPRDYPMVAPNYAQARSEMAKAIGLGQGGRQPVKALAKPPEAPAAAPAPIAAPAKPATKARAKAKAA